MATNARVLHYRLERKLGEDALGEVYLAVDEALEREVVIKRVRAGAAAAADEVAGWRAYFRSEARRAARVSHASLVTIHAYEEVGDADAIVMEYAPGQTIEEMLGRGARWWPATSVRHLIRIADAVDAAHAQGIAHGHLSLQNVKLSSEGRLKVLDLGIPKLAPGAALPLAAAAGQGPQGKPQADVRQLGEMADRLITVGRRTADEPGGEGAVPLDQALDGWIMEALDPVLERALARKAGERYASAGEFAAALRAVLDGAVQAAATPYRRGTWGYTRADFEPGMRGGSARAADDEDEAAEEASPSFASVRSHSGPPSPSRLVLPPGFDPSLVPDDLPLLPMAPPTIIHRGRHWLRRVDLRGSRRLVGAALVVLVAAGGAAAWMIAGGDEPPQSADERVAATPQTPTVTTPPPIRPDSIAAPAATLEGTIRSPVPGAVARVLDGDGSAIALPADLSVPVGDSLVIEISRAGYLSATRVFRGGTVDVALVPDSVTVAFRSNVSATVLLGRATGALNERRIGETNATLRLPTGRYRVVFRTPYHPDWVTSVAWTTAGGRHAVEKTDYATRGDLMVTVDGTWARVSVDGGTAYETPFRFEDLPIGPHVVRLAREGYVTITDTVLVRPGPAQTQRYTLRPAQ